MRRNVWQFCSRVRRVATEVAREWGLEPLAVMEAAVHLQREERESLEDLIEARRAAREYTGLTFARISRLEDAGKDHTNVAGLDLAARHLAKAYPVLGLGEGYEQENGCDDTDHAALLWEMLRQPDPVIRSQHDYSLVREAAEMVAGTCEVAPF